MADDPVVAKALEKIAFHEAETARLKRWVNGYDEMAGEQPRFGDVGAGAEMAGGPVRTRAGKQWQPGDFLGKPFATAARSIMLARAEAAGGGAAPASVDDIQEALLQGAFDFGTANSENQKQSIRISLGKNSVTFVRIPNSDLFGLLEWYPGLKKAGKSQRKAGEKDQGTSAVADEPNGDEIAGDEAAVSAAEAAPKMPWADQK
ncbi:hypothetical protein [Bradyrhizobium erythrophlei]|uniref:Uncharacterized protein n=1 Tax=Bradyrhizobium erythrophlei TaxID=1437360 RepID=A0A1M5JRK9_9BRAD|nr:hypothetical protein [Bradyrhizobium erythrophlei]SHG43055.1 hypothetical protein SAMN05443248_1537 [Bradyrhizobium erythrophlei]